jgi:hypothetical protein
MSAAADAMRKVLRANQLTRTRRVAHGTGLSHNAIWRKLHEGHFYPSHVENIQEQLPQTADIFSRQRERPTSTNPQLCDSNINLVVIPRWVLDTKTDWPTDRRS